MQGDSPQFATKGLENREKPVSKVDDPAEIWTGHLPTTSVKRLHFPACWLSHVEMNKLYWFERLKDKLMIMTIKPK
jgi:hypothetical protein